MAGGALKSCFGRGGDATGGFHPHSANLSWTHFSILMSQLIPPGGVQPALNNKFCWSLSCRKARLSMSSSSSWRPRSSMLAKKTTASTAEMCRKKSCEPKKLDRSLDQWTHAARAKKAIACLLSCGIQIIIICGHCGVDARSGWIGSS